MLTVPLAHEGRAHLLKFEVPEFPLVVDNEAFFLDVARRLRHPVVQSQVVHDRQGRPGLLVTRFDRVVDGDRLRRLAVEDGAQVLGIHPADKYTVSMEDLATALAGVCRSRPLALRSVLQQSVLAWATGNGDLHAKNISVVGAADRAVAPIYDIPSTVPYGDTTFALPLAGRRDNLTAKAFHRFGETVGLPAAAVDRVLEEVLAPPPTSSPGSRKVESSGTSGGARTWSGRCDDAGGTSAGRGSAQAHTRTSSLPKFLPWSMPMKASGAFSSPSTTSSR